MCGHVHGRVRSVRRRLRACACLSKGRGRTHTRTHSAQLAVKEHELLHHRRSLLPVTKLDTCFSDDVVQARVLSQAEVLSNLLSDCRAVDTRMANVRALAALVCVDLRLNLLNGRPPGIRRGGLHWRPSNTTCHDTITTRRGVFHQKERECVCACNAAQGCGCCVLTPWSTYR